MLSFEILTIFPDFFSGPLETSLIKKARGKKIIKISVRNLRDYTDDRHRTVDDRIYGGGPGMVFKPEPIFKAVGAILKIKKPTREKIKKGTRVILTTPQGEKFNSARAQELAQAKKIVIICGHYEGIDERVAQNLVTDEISIGDYVLMGGEAAAVVIMEAVARFLPGVVGKKDSVEEESFAKGILDFPAYTRPEEFAGLRVPEVLLSGNHQAISGERLKEAFKKTLLRRPELLADCSLGEKEKRILTDIIKEKEENL